MIGWITKAAGAVRLGVRTVTNFSRVKEEVLQAHRATEDLLARAHELDRDARATLREIHQATVALRAYVQGKDVDSELARKGLLGPRSRTDPS